MSVGAFVKVKQWVGNKITQKFQSSQCKQLYEIFVKYVEFGELFDLIVQIGKLPESKAHNQFLLWSWILPQYFSSPSCEIKHKNILIDFGLSNLMKDRKYLKITSDSPNYATQKVILRKSQHGSDIRCLELWINCVCIALQNFNYFMQKLLKALLIIKSADQSIPSIKVHK
ncbi:unnamed protein product [Paramecium sonneborni]|uniref:Protein kinase domain-containing protein n=1 Tax=Paramecium sonneborni TaxID=65129 RepID=A0A8S1RPG0_9CILI|nr:unnamed protein product [Paramecium sonneborni]